MHLVPQSTGNACRVATLTAGAGDDHELAETLAGEVDEDRARSPGEDRRRRLGRCIRFESRQPEHSGIGFRAPAHIQNSRELDAAKMPLKSRFMRLVPVAFGCFRFGSVRVSYWKNDGKAGAPGEIRTHDLCLRRAALYPAELRVPRGVRPGGINTAATPAVQAEYRKRMGARSFARWSISLGGSLLVGRARRRALERQGDYGKGGSGGSSVTPHYVGAAVDRGLRRR